MKIKNRAGRLHISPMVEMKSQKFLRAVLGSISVLDGDRAYSGHAVRASGALPVKVLCLGLVLAGLGLSGCRTGAGGGRQDSIAGGTCCVTNTPLLRILVDDPESPPTQELPRATAGISEQLQPAWTNAAAGKESNFLNADTNQLPVAGGATNPPGSASDHIEQESAAISEGTNPPPVLLVVTGTPATVVLEGITNELQQAESTEADTAVSIVTNVQDDVSAVTAESGDGDVSAFSTNGIPGAVSTTNAIVMVNNLEKPLNRAARFLADWTSIGAVYAFETIDTREDFAYGELRAAYSLDELIHVHDRLDLQIGVGAGVFTDEENELVGFPCIGPMLVCSLSDLNLTVEIGSRFGFLTNDRLGIESFGGQVHFLSHASFRWNIGDNWQWGLRGQHLSNAGLEDVNPGIDLLAVELLYVR